MSYTFQDFKQDILQGKEIEFKFEDKQYSITNTKSGFCFTEFHSDVDECYEHASDLIQKVRINGKAFEEIFAQNAFHLITLY